MISIDAKEKELDVIIEELSNLIENRKMRAVKERLIGINEVDIAYILEEIPDASMVLLFRLLPKDIAADTFAYLDTEAQQYIINAISDIEISAIVDELYVDDVVDSLEELPSNLVKKLLKSATPEKRELINHFLNYPKHSAGSMMTSEFRPKKRYDS